MWNKPTIFVGRSVVHDHAVLHELVEVRISAVENIDATGGDLTVDSSEFSVNDVVLHMRSILSGPAPGRVRGFQETRRFGCETVGSG